MHPQTIDLCHGELLFDSLEKHAVGLLNSSNSVSGLKPNLSLSDLGTTIRPYFTRL